MNLIVALTGASGALAAKLLLERSQWPVTLVASRMGRVVYEQEVGRFDDLAAQADTVWNDQDLTASIASGSVPSVGMVILPCSINTLAKIGGGIGDSLITRAAHCQLKERRPLLLCVREAPWTLISAQSAVSVAAAGGTVMPLSPPFYMMKGRNPNDVSMTELLGWYADHVLSFLGQPSPVNWEDIRDAGFRKGAP